MKYLLFFLFIFTVTVNDSYSQDIFVFNSRYNREVQKQLMEYGFKSMSILTVGNIDPNRTNQVDEDTVKQFLSRFFPDKGNQRYLVIDWEEDLYKDLSRSQKSKEFARAVAEYIRLTKIIKEYDRSIKIGIYGLPFRLYPKSKNTSFLSKFDRLFEHVDFLCPSLYTINPIREIGKEKNSSYFNKNLDQVFSYAVRLNKPVIPFVWEVVHGNNKIYGRSIVPDDEFIENLETIFNYNYQGHKVRGVIWWAPSKAGDGYTRTFRFQGNNNSENRNLYMKHISNKVKSIVK